jgi:hypothetical protein
MNIDKQHCLPEESNVPDGGFADDGRGGGGKEEAAGQREDEKRVRRELEPGGGSLEKTYYAS